MSFNSGVLVTKQHSERDKADLRRHGLRGEEREFVGATMSKRVHKTPRQNLAEDKEREEAEAFPTDRDQVLAKRPKDRLKWLQRGLMFAAKKHVKIGDLYDIACHKKFVVGVNNAIGSQMEGTLLANLHLFSTKQQRYLQSSASLFHEFTVRKSAEKTGEKISEKASEKDRAATSDSESSSSSSTKRAPAAGETQSSSATASKKAIVSESAAKKAIVSESAPAAIAKEIALPQLRSDSPERKSSGSVPADPGQLGSTGGSPSIAPGINGVSVSNGGSLAVIRLPGYYSIPYSCRLEEARLYTRGAADEFVAAQRAGSRSRSHSREQQRRS